VNERALWCAPFRFVSFKSFRSHTVFRGDLNDFGRFSVCGGLGAALPLCSVVCGVCVCVYIPCGGGSTARPDAQHIVYMRVLVYAVGGCSPSAVSNYAVVSICAVASLLANHLSER
jgi:hypothetical protein